MATEPSSSVYLNERVFVQDQGDTPQLFSGGCMSIGQTRSKVSSSAGDAKPTPASAPLQATGSGMAGGDLIISVSRNDESPTSKVQVVSTAGEILAERSYSDLFVRAGQMDSFTVPTSATRQYLFFYWGGDCSKDLTLPSW